MSGKWYAKRVNSVRAKNGKGTASQLAENVDVALDFWVAQRFTAAITALF